ncbi:MAG: hypothetical protein IJ705_01785 [Oscillospiraceae bacterium]|nr:hypothetical protein [Oscillospiraceae bacterium]
MKRTAALLLCAALLLALVPAGSAADAEDDRLGFVAINDIMPPELVDCQMFYGGVYYVPYYVFTDYGLGLSYSYFASAATAYFSTTEKQLFFDLNSGATYDGNDTHYAVSAISRGGTVYVPVGLVCRIFGGMTYSIIAGNEYGNILRLKTDAVVLSDAEFLRAARSLMRSYYQSYQSGEGGGPVPDATPEPISHEGDRALLGFVGLPGDELLKTLARYEFDA